MSTGKISKRKNVDKKTKEYRLEKCRKEEMSTRKKSKRKNIDYKNVEM